MFLRFVLLICGVCACATAIIMIKLSHMPPMLLSGYRLMVAGVVLSPLLVRDLRAAGRGWQWRQLRVSLLPGVMLGLHFISWVIGARKTGTVNASLIVNMVPIAMPFFLLALVREKLTRGEVLGTIVAVAGLGLLTLSDFHLSDESFSGDVICFVSMLLFCCYLALGRRNRHLASIWVYLVPLYLAGGAMCLAAAALGGEWAQAVRYDAREILLALGLGVIPTVMGHSILNYSMKHIRGQAVSIVNLFQFFFAGTMAYFWLDEVPQKAFVPAAVLALAGAIIVLRHHARRPRAEEA